MVKPKLGPDTLEMPKPELVEVEDSDPTPPPALEPVAELLRPADLLADLLDSIEEQVEITPPPKVAPTEQIRIAQPRTPSRTPASEQRTPLQVPQPRGPSGAKQTPPPSPAKRAMSPRPTSTPGSRSPTSTSGAAEVAGAPAQFKQKLAALLGRYELLDEVLKTGPIVGVFAKNRDTKAPVVVRAIDQDRIDDARLPRDEWIAAFERELMIAKKVSHPLLPKVLDSGSQGSMRFAVYEHAEGAPLHLVIERGKMLGADTVRKIISSAATALHALHERGFVFCNMQAHAVWFTKEGQGRLFDLSMAAPMSGPFHPLLPSNVFALSPEYLRGRDYGAGSDQFALGALLYELLTSTRPFRGLDTDTIVAAIRDKEPKAPHTMDSRVDRLLSDVAMRAIDKDPGRRFNSLAELARLIAP
jgi:serine/threonine-protein kinase